MDAPPRGEGGFPALPRKNDQNRGEAAGQKKERFPIFQKKKPLIVQFYKTEQCSIQPVNRMQKTPSFTIQCWGLFFWISKKWKSSFLFFCQQGFELCSPKFVNLWNSSFMSQISSLMLLMMIAIMMIMIIMMEMLIMITIKIINVEHIWLISLDAMWIKISFAVACDFNHLVYTVYSPPWPLPAPPREKKLPHPSLDYTL